MPDIDISIIVLSYQSQMHLEVLLPSIEESAKGLSVETIIVDNGSTDGSKEWLKQQMDKGANFKLISLADNLGFSKGNNLGIKEAKGRYILLLNPDTKLSPDTLQTMTGFMDNHPEVGAGGCKLVKPDGKLDLACRRRFPNPVNSFKRLFLTDNKDYNYTDIDDNQSMEVDSVVGAFMFIRREATEKIGLLDEKFFMYGEDLDWCWRCKEAGYKVWYLPETTVLHYKGESSKKVSFKALFWFHEAMWIFYKKHYSPKYFFIFNWIVWLGIYLRLLTLSTVNIFRRKKFVSR
ncbi:MAG: glycosyl transferase family 2 [Candidatus Doudnabacteria bacterium CG10_big_fil_rev_8_21_14_0_10_42_18]|uniref:Glycosyl transferase family 2 n=1 Tax=Candidatus Doudnabacteria bacterium CG10_big_fil_rev_8_21_14_0_10_42_18 TaxID=1974552 RepID=A0A2H0VAK0_9BACT|nr:MAG: glycosyl transferase family 2 [Candidatus Doudnabacteria bacterium CG10_big_fil_rev_8_21_14_0_10_42_18]